MHRVSSRLELPKQERCLGCRSEAPTRLRLPQNSANVFLSSSHHFDASHLAEPIPYTSSLLVSLGPKDRRCCLPRSDTKACSLSCSSTTTRTMTADTITWTVSSNSSGKVEARRAGSGAERVVDGANGGPCPPIFDFLACSDSVARIADSVSLRLPHNRTPSPPAEPSTNCRRAAPSPTPASSSW